MVKNVKNDVGSESIQIRAHHLLCMQGFQGYGYSEEFTENMAHITDKLRENPSTFLKIVLGSDSICDYCPHYSNGSCNMEPTSESRIRLMDDLLIRELKLKEGSVISWAEVKSLTNNLSPQAISKVCGNCFWGEKCIYFQEKGYKTL